MRFHHPLPGLLTSETKLKIIEFLLHHEASMSEREIASVVGVSHMSVNRAMQELAEMNFIHSKVVGKAHLWTVNRKSYAYAVLTKLVAHLQSAPDPLMELKRVIRKNLPKPLVQKAVLFGSLAERRETADSDLDLFILVKNAQDQKALERSLEKLSMECLDIFGNRLAPYILTEKQYKEKKGLDVLSAIEKGILLYPNEAPS